MPENTPLPSSDAVTNRGVEAITTLLAHQSIVDDAGKVIGFELFNRSTAAHKHDADSDATALFRALSHAGTDALFDQQTLFINCTHDSLSGEHLELVRPEHVVLEVPPVTDHEPVEIATMLRKMEVLVQSGFRVAFDHTALTEPYAAWLPMASFLKLDGNQLQPDEIAACVQRAREHGAVTLIADKVETAEQFGMFHRLGVRYFQGYWISHPVVITARLLAPSQATILELLHLVQQKASIEEIEDLLKRDPTLSFSLLRFINASDFGLSSEITSFRHAVLILGVKKLFRWASMLLPVSTVGATPAASGHLAVLRGRLMENLVLDLLSKEDADNAFVVGIFSMLDTMLGMPMDQALNALSLPNPVRDALLNRSGPLAPFLHLAEVCETGTDDDVALAADALTLSAHEVNVAHLEALVWTDSSLVHHSS